MFGYFGLSGYEKLLYASSNIPGRCICQVWPTGIIGIIPWSLYISSLPARIFLAVVFIMLSITAIITAFFIMLSILAYLRRSRGIGHLKKPFRNWRTLVIKIQRIRKLQRIHHNTGMALQFYFPASKPLLTRLSYIYSKSERVKEPDGYIKLPQSWIIWQT